MGEETAELKPPESNREQYQRWVNYIDSELWPKVLDLESSCSSLHAEIRAKGFGAKLEMPALTQRCDEMTTKVRGIVRSLENYAQTFSSKKMQKVSLKLPIILFLIYTHCSI